MPAPKPDVSMLTIDFNLANAATKFGMMALTVSNAPRIFDFRPKRFSVMVFNPFALAASSNLLIMSATPRTTAFFTLPIAVRIPPADVRAISANPPWTPLSSIILSANWSIEISPSLRAFFSSGTLFLPKASAILFIRPGAASATELNSSAWNLPAPNAWLNCLRANSAFSVVAP